MNVIRDERGETLVELLVTILVIAIGFVAVVGAMGSSIIFSDANQSHAQSEVVIRDFSEELKNNAASISDHCPAETDLEIPSYVPPISGWTASVTKVEYWIPAAGFTDGEFVEGTAGQTECQAQLDACATDNCQVGLERLTIQ